MKVLFLVPNLRASNGVASFALNYFRNMDPGEVHIDFALYQDRASPYYGEIRERGCEIFILPSVKHMKEHLRACDKILREGHYDIIHDCTLHISLLMMLCARNHHVPVRLLHSHSAKMGETKKKEIRNRLFMPVLRSLATDYAACSKLAGKAMFGKRDFTYIPNVVDSRKYMYNEVERLKIRGKYNSKNKRIVGTVGRLAPQKNPIFAMDVFKKFSESCRDVEYWWIGNGDMDRQVKDYAEKIGIADHVRFWGGRDDVIELYQAMDVFFLPSLFEGLPVTGIEAQAMGLPMVVSDTVTNEIVYTDLVDYVSLASPLSAWSDHLQAALSRNVRREAYAEQLKASLFSDVQCGERLRDVYQRMLEKR